MTSTQPGNPALDLDAAADELWEALLPHMQVASHASGAHNAYDDKVKALELIHDALARRHPQVEADVLRKLVPGFRLDWSGLRNRFDDIAARLEKLTTYESRSAYLDELARQFEDAASAALAALQGQEVVALPIASAPRDGTMIRLLVKYDHGNMECHPLADSAEPSWTIGFNNLDHDGEDRWLFAGWDWEQDCFRDSEGEPIGWLPFHAASPLPSKKTEGDLPAQLDAIAWFNACWKISGTGMSKVQFLEKYRQRLGVSDEIVSRMRAALTAAPLPPAQKQPDLGSPDPFDIEHYEGH